MRILLTLLSTVALLHAPASLVAQQGASAARPDTAAVHATIIRMFDAMRAVDTAAMRAVFVPRAVLVSVADSGGIARVDTTSIDDFLAGLARAKERNPQLVPDERLSGTKIEVDGALASVWTDYGLWINERFSHCGVDAFHLVRTAEGWRILQLADTRRREGCQAG